jgi:CheY-like chemotaxis protein/3,4-dihydroxy-2-butanone 4-phosphate synthase
MIQGDVLRIRQVLINMVGNAVKFTDKGEVEIRVFLDQPLPEKGKTFSLWISVRDTGVGIPAQEVGKLFQAFSQADLSITRKFGGTGLGLAITQRLIQLMGGQIGVVSKEGEGSVFTCFIETKELDIPSQTGISDSDRARLAGLRILLLEDHLQFRQILSRDLEALQMKVWQAGTGEEARAFWSGEESFNVIISDVWKDSAPWKDWVAGIARHHTPLVLISPAFSNAYTSVENVPTTTVVVKPFRLQKLTSAIVQVVSSHERSAAVSNQPDNQVPHMLAVSLPMNILVAEDNLVNQKIFTKMLEKMGYPIRIAPNGASAIGMFEEEYADLIFMDMQMPVMDGLTATRKIRQQYEAHMQPIIVAVTANAMQGDRELCLQAGMNDYISKPFQQADLRRILEKWGPGVILRSLDEKL